MAVEVPFAFRSVKISMLNIPEAYADLSGGSLNTSTYTPWSQVIDSIVAAGANNVTLVVSAGTMKKATDNGFDPAINNNPDLAVVRKLAALIKSRGLSVSLQTFTNVDNVISGDASAGSDRPQPTDAATWQRNFSDSVLKWASFASEIGANAFMPFGDETQHLLQKTELLDGWMGLIDQIRARFSGILSTYWYTPGYATGLSNFSSKMIAALDYLGLGFNPDLSTNTNASTEELAAAYFKDVKGRDLISYLKELSQTYAKKIWITDKVFHSFDGAAANAERIYTASIPLTQDFQEQARLYDSFLQVMTKYGGDWLAGVSFSSYNNISDDNTAVARFLNGPLSESPQGKPAEQILTSWFNGQRQGEGLTLTDGIRSTTLEGGYHHDVLIGGAGNDKLYGYAGNDRLVGGANNLQQVNVYTVEVSLRGVQAGGIAPVIEVVDAAGTSVVSQAVTSPLVVSAATQSGAATKLVFELTELKDFELREKNWEFLDFTDLGNRFVRVEGISINGTSLTLPQVLTYVPPEPRAPMPGSVDSVHGGKFSLDMDVVKIAPKLVTQPDDDILVGGSGDDVIDGGAGRDIAVFSGAAADYKISIAGGTWTVSALKGTDGNDTLNNIERLQFADTRIALDLDGNAGKVARILGAVFGPAAVSNKQYVGTGLNLLDKGMSYQDVMGLALGVAGAKTPTAVVNLLWTNIFGKAPTQAQAAPYVAMLESGSQTAGSLGVLAADLDFNKTNIDLIGLQSTGLAYLL